MRTYVPAHRRWMEPASTAQTLRIRGIRAGAVSPSCEQYQRANIAGFMRTMHASGTHRHRRADDNPRTLPLRELRGCVDNPEEDEGRPSAELLAASYRLCRSARPITTTVSAVRATTAIPSRVTSMAGCHWTSSPRST